ncbi:MAG: DUF2191 domain-containing protein [Gemmatimonadetes bacterium]|nr:MAG: DUF2191 domain-containing protein [Gemmatimonadota bacterium]
MKTTLDIRDELILRAKKLARRTGRPLRAVVEDGLRMVLSTSGRDQTYELPDCSVGDPDAPDPLEALSWHDLRDEIYGRPESR